ncbi:ribosomal RNA processing protein 36 homolog isoform X2 [Macrobrachium nipponense]
MWEKTSARIKKSRGVYSSPKNAVKNKHIIFDNYDNDSDELAPGKGHFGNDSDELASGTGHFGNGKFKHEKISRIKAFDTESDSGEELYNSKFLKQDFKGRGGSKLSSSASSLKRKHTRLDDFSSDEYEEGSSESESEFEQSDEESAENNFEEDKDYSGMTMEELLKLQEEMGMKAFREKVLKVSKSEKTSSDQAKSFKRLNKNRPSEMPLMRKRAPLMNSMQPGKKLRKIISRDPRFDDLSGDLKLDLWHERYQFLKDARMKELEILKNELQEETNPGKKEKLKRTIQRMENQQREGVRKEQETVVSRLEKKHQREALKQGKKPKYMKKKDKKLLLKTMHFDELRKGNRVNKYLKRKEEKLAKKERRQDSTRKF